jgi:hypothetical protein
MAGHTAENYARPSLQGENQPASWREAFLAGLPHLIVAFVFLMVALASSTWIEDGSLKMMEIAALVLIWSGIGAVVVAAFFAWRKGWPRWAASYYFYWFLAIGAPILLIFQNMDNDFGYRVMDVLLMVVYILALVVWIYAVTRRDSIKGLLMIAPAAVLFWSFQFEFMADEFTIPLRVGMFLIIAMAAVLIARFGSWRLGIWTVIGASMVVGLPISYFRTFHHNIPPQHFNPATAESLSERFVGTLFWSALLIVAPLLIWALLELSKRLGQRGKLGYRLIFTGILINLTSTLVLHQGYYFKYLPNKPLREVGFPIIIGLSALAYFTGVALVLRTAKRQGVLPDAITRVLLGLVASVLPFTFLIQIFTSLRVLPTNLPFGLFSENAVPKLLYYGLGLLWLLLAAWLLTRLRVPEGPRHFTGSRSETLDVAHRITLWGATTILTAAFLPWIDSVVLFGTDTLKGIERGWEGDGVISGGIAVLLIVWTLIARTKNGWGHALGSLALAGLVTAIVVADFGRVLEVGPEAGFFAAVDVGLYLTLTGALLVAAGSALRLHAQLGENRARKLTAA